MLLRVSYYANSTDRFWPNHKKLCSFEFSKLCYLLLILRSLENMISPKINFGLFRISFDLTCVFETQRKLTLPTVWWNNPLASITKTLSASDNQQLIWELVDTTVERTFGHQIFCHGRRFHNIISKDSWLPWMIFFFFNVCSIEDFFWIKPQLVSKFCWPSTTKSKYEASYILDIKGMQTLHLKSMWNWTKLSTVY